MRINDTLLFFLHTLRHMVGRIYSHMQDLAIDVGMSRRRMGMTERRLQKLLGLVQDRGLYPIDTRPDGIHVVGGNWIDLLDDPLQQFYFLGQPKKTQSNQPITIKTPNGVFSTHSVPVSPVDNLWITPEKAVDNLWITHKDLHAKTKTPPAPPICINIINSKRPSGRGNILLNALNTHLNDLGLKPHPMEQSDRFVELLERGYSEQDILWVINTRVAQYRTRRAGPQWLHLDHICNPTGFARSIDYLRTRPDYNAYATRQTRAKRNTIAYKPMERPTPPVYQPPVVKTPKEELLRIGAAYCQAMLAKLADPVAVSQGLTEPYQRVHMQAHALANIEDFAN